MRLVAGVGFRSGRAGSAARRLRRRRAGPSGGPRGGRLRSGSSPCTGARRPRRQLRQGGLGDV